MRDTLQPGELAFPYGAILSKKTSTSVSAKILTQMKAGAYSTVQFQVTFEVDAGAIIPYNHPNDPPIAGNYRVNFNEVGFAENAEISLNSALGQLFVNFQGATPMLNISVPLGDPIKRDSGDLILKHSKISKTSKIKAAKK